MNGTIFEKKKSVTQIVFWFPLRLLSKTILVLRRIQRGVTKQWVPVIFVTFWLKSKFFRRIVVKSANIKFHEMLTQREKSRSMWTDGQTRRYWQSHFANFRKRVKNASFPGAKSLHHYRMYLVQFECIYSEPTVCSTKYCIGLYTDGWAGGTGYHTSVIF